MLYCVEKLSFPSDFVKIFGPNIASKTLFCSAVNDFGWLFISSVFDSDDMNRKQKSAFFFIYTSAENTMRLCNTFRIPLNLKCFTILRPSVHVWSVWIKLESALAWILPFQSWMFFSGRLNFLFGCWTFYFSERGFNVPSKLTKWFNYLSTSTDSSYLCALHTTYENIMIWPVILNLAIAQCWNGSKSLNDKIIT